MMSQPENFPLAEISFFLFFLVPMCIIAIQYTRMGLRISKQTRRLGVNGSVHRGSNRRSQSHKAVIRMLGRCKYCIYFSVDRLKLQVFVLTFMYMCIHNYVCFDLPVKYTKDLKYFRRNECFTRQKQQLKNKLMNSLHVLFCFTAAVVIGFFVCWAPFHAQRLLVIYGRDFTYYHELNAWMFYITGILYYFSSTLNPVLYNVMSNRYRNAFKEILCGIKTKHKLLRRSSTFRETRLSTDNFKRVSNSDALNRHSSKRQFIRNSTGTDVIMEEDILQLVQSEESSTTKVFQSFCFVSEETTKRTTARPHSNKETCI